MGISAQNKKRLENMSPNLIYAFIPESEVKREVFGKYVDAIQFKREAQRTFIQGVARSNLYTNSEKFYDYTREQLEEVYGMSIQDIIYHLAEYGSLPASKYEKDAIAGIKCSIGSYTEQAIQDMWNSQYKQQMTFNPSTGKMQIGGSNTYTQKNYDTFGNTWMNYYSPSTGLSATALKTGNSYSLVTGSNGESTINLSTGATVAPNQNNFWNNLNDALPAIQGLLSTVFNFLQFNVTPRQMSPSQVGDGWAGIYNPSTNNLTTGLILTGLVGGAVLLSQGDKKRK